MLEWSVDKQEYKYLLVSKERLAAKVPLTCLSSLIPFLFRYRVELDPQGKLPEAKELYQEIKKIMQEAVKARGKHSSQAFKLCYLFSKLMLTIVIMNSLLDLERAIFTVWRS